jgi:uncharacterized protein YcfL
MKWAIFCSLLALVVVGCDAQEVIYKAKSTSPVLTTLNGPGKNVVASEHTHTMLGNDGMLVIKCKKSDTSTCHYRVWQVVSESKDSATKSATVNIAVNETFFQLAVDESKTIKPALEGSSFCHASDKSPDAAACPRTKF